MTLERLARQPMEAVVEPLADPLPYRKFRVTLRSLDGVPIRAYLGVPLQQEGQIRRLPAVITAPGYGGLHQSIMLDDCLRGYVVLQVYPRSQGDSGALWKIDGPDKLTWRLASPEGSYYQGAYADMIRGVDFLLTRPDVDPDRIAAMGTSQGGGIVLALASLDPRIRAVAAHVPFLCDFRLAARTPGSLVSQLLEKAGAPQPESFRTLDYFDPLTLVPQLRAPAIVSAGGKDNVCPPETIRTVFDRIAGVKSLVFYPDLIHTFSIDFYRAGWQWIDRHLSK
jgi:cephalosporin-C deacetylase